MELRIPNMLVGLVLARVHRLTMWNMGPLAPLLDSQACLTPSPGWIGAKQGGSDIYSYQEGQLVDREQVGQR